MKILLIVGIANDVFIYNMSKWLKAYMDVSIDVFEFYPSNEQGYSSEYFDNVYTVDSFSFCRKVKALRILNLDAYYNNYFLYNWLEYRSYDIIHCHWLVPDVVVSNKLKKYCKKLFVTFWGGELERQNILLSHRLYLFHLKHFLKNVDVIANSKVFSDKLRCLYPFLDGKIEIVNLGSNTIAEIARLSENESKEDSKRILNIAANKKTILIGYSGKSLHRHIPIINALANNVNKEKFHILAPMTRGVVSKYVKQVEHALNVSGCTYTLLKDSYLSDLDIARLRNATDIVLQLSLFDGYSRSIIECLYAKAILIYGDWLEYSNRLKEDGYNGIAVSSIGEAMLKIVDIIDDFDEYKSRLVSDGGGRNYMWSECIKDWVKCYKTLV